MISMDECDEAFHFLNDTISEFADAKARLYGLEKSEKIILSEELIDSARKTLGMKEAEARTSNAYRKWRQTYVEAVRDFEIIRAKRIHADMIWRRWQSEFSAQKQGIVI